MKQLLLLLAVTLFFGCTQAQTKSLKSIQFTQAWVWEYQNDLVAESEPGHKGELVVYYQPRLNYWLFTAEAYGTSGEMYNWIVGKPDGSYILCATDEFGKQVITKQNLEIPLNKTLPKYFQPTGKKKTFNQNQLGFSKIEGREFKVVYRKTNDQSSVFFSDFKADFLPLYFFNRLNTEAKLPFRFPEDLPKQTLLLQENSEVNNVKIRLVFKEISHTEYFIDLKGE